ncbi:GntR family transcriptional regulator [Scopulibacillus cellulosilyticus]|uniref:GntR family transcriptional regulator n=1 Tax=Scopulibacillus cellulosilyticus TaxID=2665665 RepID=A0ABW2PTW3_9BACL
MESPTQFIKETTTMAVYKHLKKLILTGQFRPGEWIRERQVKELLDVSSTPVREALRMLVQEGILVSVPHRGVRLKILSKKELQDFYELRSEVEGLAARLAAARRTEAQCKKMDDLLKITEIKLNNSSDFGTDAADYNNAFHDLIAEASNNQALINSLSKMRTEVNLLRVMLWKSEKQRPITTLNQHRLIFQAIAEKDSHLARQRIREHIEDSAKLVLRVAEKALNKEN